MRKSGRIKFYRKIEGEKYIVVPGDDFAKENIRVIGNSNDLWKFPSGFANKILLPGWFVIETLPGSTVNTILSRHQISFRKETTTPIIIARIENRKQFDIIVANPEVLFVKSYVPAKEESPNSMQDLSVNRINFVHDTDPDLNGEGLAVSVKERTIDTADIDLKNRFLRTALADSIISLHANQIATIIAGGGNSIMSAKGIAWRSKILSSSYDNLLPDDISVLQSNNCFTQNHSYGTSIDSFYGPEAKAYDEQSVSNPYNINIFSSGNSGMLTAGEGAYANISGYSNLTGNVKMAKNVIVVGGHKSFYELDERNSNGPAFDGRIKPELVAFGPEGTSDAAAFVSGVSALIQQAFRDQHDVLPRIDLVKAVLLVSADDIAQAGIDHKTGYGALNARRASDVVKNARHFSGTVSSNDSEQFEIEILPNVKQVRVCLNWIDPAVASGSSKALVNDLDMTMVSPDEEITLPWRLSHYPHIDSLALPAKRREDHLNNIEYITLDAPDPGIYRIVVRGNELFTAQQSFSVAYDFVLEDEFLFTYPTSTDRVSADELVVRWESGYEGTGSLMASTDDGQNYFAIANVPLENGYYALVPEFTGPVILKMNIDGEDFLSERFLISKEPGIDVLFVCDETMMVSWDKIEGAAEYNLLTMGDEYLEHVTTLSDTVMILQRSDFPSNYFAVEPVIDAHPAYRSAAYDVTKQGVQCYYRDLSVMEENHSAVLTLNLSTTYNVDKVLWQKKSDEGFELIGETLVSDLSPAFVDDDLSCGVTTYKAIIVLVSQENISTDEAVLYYADNSCYLLFPNPVETTQELKVLTDGNDLTIHFFDTSGKLVKSQEILSSLFYFTVSDLQPGLYFYRLQRGADWVSSGKLVLK